MSESRTARQDIHRLVAERFGLEAEQAPAAVQRFERVTIAGGDWLFHQADPADALFLLIRGRMAVWMRESTDAPRLLGEVVPGETVGEIGLLTGQARTAGIQATRDCLLLKIDRDGFHALAEAHPAMALKLAGSIAARLQQRTAGAAGSTRNLTNICLLPLDESGATTGFMDDLSSELAGFGKLMTLDPEQLEELGAPMTEFRTDSPVPGALVDWLEARESEHRFMIYRCPAAASEWAAFACRQADLILRIGEAGRDPAIRAFERDLDARQGDCPHRTALVLVRAADDPVADTAAWLAQREVDFHLHVRRGHEGDLARAGRILAGEAVGLVLGAGAARGFAHIGVFRALSEAGIPVDWVGGSSIGSVIGGAIACDWTPEQVRERCHDGLVRHNPFRDFTLPMVSLLAGRVMMRSARRLLGRYIEDLPIPFFCVSANLDSGTLNIHNSGPLHKAIQAAAALPGALPPAVVEKHLAIDGAVINSLPVDIMRRMPVGRVIAVDLSSRKSYEVDYDEVPSAWALLRARLNPFARRYRVPGLVTLLLKSAEVGTLERVQRLGAEADLLINPDVRRFGMTEVKAFDRIVEAGYDKAKECLEQCSFTPPGPNAG